MVPNEAAPTLFEFAKTVKKPAMVAALLWYSYEIGEGNCFNDYDICGEITCPEDVPELELPK